MSADPREQCNLHGQSESAMIQSELEKRLFDWSIQTSDVVPFDEGPRGFPARTLSKLTL